MRSAKESCIVYAAVSLEDEAIESDMILGSINHCYDIIDSIDETLEAGGSEKLSSLVELANLSSMVGNLLGEGLARHSGSRYVRNKPHTYPDLIAVDKCKPGFELKVALESNYPKGHLPKSGYYITYRYVLTDTEGNFVKGKENRGDTVTIWEVRFGYLAEDDFSISNTSGDSGKTAVIKTAAMNNMKLCYFDDECVPYRHSKERPYPGYNAPA